ncbi:GDSL-type esterase/lipase family protein [Nocardia acidivorans]|uniref:GDSL-type esterase/lipase family protein n=1 Tax=Nocardia acidivorans TaxID=404580 RepID=UPI00082E3422|nr:GDSL-type esterase/lipase family protein [Nocardia acidivorans]
MRRNAVRVIAALITGFLVVAAAAAAAPVPAPGWRPVWVSAMQRPGDSFAPNWSGVGFGNQTVRQVIRVSSAGSLLRLRLSNRFGARPLRVTGATIARSAGGAVVRPDSLRPLTIEGKTAFQIEAGSDAVTDSIIMPVAALERLAVTLYFADATGPATFHAQAQNTSYLAWDDHRTDPMGNAFTVNSSSWYYLTAVEIEDPRPSRATVALFGDSFTEGVGSTYDAHHTYPDELTEGFVAQGKSRPVLNLGIGGNCLTVDSPWLGDSGLTRFGRDVLDQRGVGTVVILEGINDIWLNGATIALGAPVQGASAEQLITGFRTLIAQAHGAGLRVVGATILPAAGSLFVGGDRARYAERERVRTTVNGWILGSGEYDAVVDSAAALADPADRDRLAPAFDSGDHLHPNDAGYAALAAAVAAVLN